MSLPDKPLGIGLLTVGGLCFVAAGLIAWGGVNHWLAAGYLTTAGDKALAGDASAARSEARDAMDLLPREPVAVLAATDLSTPANAEALLALARESTGGTRDTLVAAAGLALGKVPDGTEPNASDAALLKAIAEKSPAAVTLSKDAPPHRALLAEWAASRLAAGFAAQKPDDVWAAASMLLTLAPRHPQAAELEIIVAGLAPNGVDKPRLIAVAGTLSDIKRRGQLGVALLTLRPERNQLRMLLPMAGNVAAENESALNTLVSAVKTAPETIHEGVIIRCLQAGKPSLVDELIAVASAERKLAFQHLGDLTDGGGITAETAHITTPIVVGGRLSFHLSTTSGALPIKRVGITIGKFGLPDDAIRHLGTLVSAKLEFQGPQSLTITYDGKPVFAANVSL